MKNRLNRFFLPPSRLFIVLRYFPSCFSPFFSSLPPVVVVVLGRSRARDTVRFNARAAIYGVSSAHPSGGRRSGTKRGAEKRERRILNEKQRERERESSQREQKSNAKSDGQQQQQEEEEEEEKSPFERWRSFRSPESLLIISEKERDGFAISTLATRHFLRDTVSDYRSYYTSRHPLNNNYLDTHSTAIINLRRGREIPQSGRKRQRDV